jgi:hypothetical protein
MPLPIPQTPDVLEGEPSGVIRTPAEANPVHSQPTSAWTVVPGRRPSRSAPDVMRERVMHSFRAAAQATVRTCQEAATRVRRVSSSAAQKLVRAKQERPLQSLAVIAGVACAIGIGLRIWRSKR